MALSFNTTQNNPATDSSDCIVIGAFSDKTFNAAGQQLDAASDGRLAALAARGDISGKIGQTVLLQDIAGIASPRILVIGLGEPAKFAVPQYLKAIADAVRTLRTGPVKSAYITLSDLPVKGRDAAWTMRQAVIAADHAAYEYTATRSKKAGVTPRKHRPAGQRTAAQRFQSGRRHRRRRAVHPRTGQPAAEHLQSGLSGRAKRQDRRRARQRQRAKCWSAKRCRRWAWARCWRWRAARPMRRS